jgi:hypothetical protein
MVGSCWFLGPYFAHIYISCAVLFKKMVYINYSNLIESVTAVFNKITFCLILKVDIYGAGMLIITGLRQMTEETVLSRRTCIRTSMILSCDVSDYIWGMDW